jgi:lipopolysaccharide/colanic/teichoic acid biosynthesis glycosyltransferase
MVGSRTALKRLIDLAASALGILVFGPVMAVIWARIMADRDGPALYSGLRAGRRGRPFRMHKFRTMVTDADARGGPSTASDDPRVTPTGQWLRRFKLDELPQLFNVLKGDMSLVGPRPEVLSEVERYTPEEMLLLSVRPGITDWASLKFHNEGAILAGAPDPHEAYLRLIRPEKVRLGLEYVRRATIADDFRILWRTVTLPFRPG